MRKQNHRPVFRCACYSCQQHPFSVVAKEHRAINRVMATLDEKNRRRFVGLLALQGNSGSVSALATITGLSRNTIRRGREEIQHGEPAEQVRRPGAGRVLVEKNSRAS